MRCKHCGGSIRWVEGSGWAMPNDSSFEIGFCSASERGHELLDAPDWERAAADRWKLLRALDPNLASREELANSGVPARTIAALLPYDFADLVPGVIALLEHDPSERPWKARRFTDTSSFDASLLQYRKVKDADYELWNASAAKAQLQAHFDAILPAKRRVKLSAQCTTALWTACWYMAHKEPLLWPASEKRDQWTVETVDLLLPNLDERIKALRQQTNSATIRKSNS